MSAPARLQATALPAEFERARARTLEIAGTLEPDDYMAQTAPYASPPKWHLGHVSWIYEAVMGKIDPGYEPLAGGMAGYLNSYYRQFGRPMDKGSRGSVSRPTLARVLEYYGAVTGRVREFAASLGPGGRGAGLLEMAVHHECQHQELLVYDLQHMLADGYRRPRSAEPPRAEGAPPAQARVAAGMYALGHAGGGYCYDVELPEHPVYVGEYLIDTLPVTNGQYMEFVEDGGYGDYRHWLSDGWDMAQAEGWEAPMYWEREGGRWAAPGLAGRRPVDPREPVCHVSFYEADAYCRWAGRRLPTEAEWEKAALWDAGAGRKLEFPWGGGPPDAGRANLLESWSWRPAEAGAYPAGASPCGCRQMIGDVWEWTSSEFVGYPGFRSGFDEYNDKWFGGRKVLRGGSFATPAASIRGSYRNFFGPGERWMFAGFRCAQDP